MQYAIIADIHGNLEAFKAVIDDIESQRSIQEIWCLGDIVGYGPEPHECIKLVKDLNCVCIAGNHDRGATGKISLSGFTSDAAEALEWTADNLSVADIAFLNGLSETAVIGKFTLVHGSPREPLQEYIASISIAREVFSCFDTQYCLFAHSHRPQIFQKLEDDACIATTFSENVKLAIRVNRLLINPGSAGQPRDGDTRASYILYYSETGIMRLRRVAYNVKKTQDLIMKKGLPVRLAGRLDSGT